MTTSLPDRAEEVYASNRWLRAGVTLIPYIGGSIDALITTRASHLAQRRIEELLAELRAAAGRLGEEKIDRRFLETEEWDDLVIRTFQAAAATQDRQKIRLYAAILAGAASTEREPELDHESALSAIADLSPLEIAVARAIYEMQRVDGPDHDLQLSEATERGWNDDSKWPAAALRNRAFHLKRIEKTGLIAEFTGAYWDYAGGVYYVTSTFRRLMRYLEARGEDKSDGASA